MAHMPNVLPKFKSRQLLLLFLCAAAVLVLASCGAKVHTTLTLNEDGSGVRAIRAELPQTELEKTEFTIDEIEGVINQKIPDGLDYKGRTEGAGGATVFNFEVTFKNSAEYEKKIVDIRSAGDEVQEVKIEHIFGEEPFTSGVRVDENFTSNELLSWLTKALIESGKAGSAGQTDLTELGDNVLVLGESKHEVNAAMTYGKVERFGFSDVEIETAGFGEETYTRTMTFELSRENYARDRSAYDAFFESVTPEGGELKKPSETGTTWVLSFPEGSAEEVASWTNRALKSEAAEFAVTTEPKAEDPLTTVYSVVDTAECTQVCQADTGVRLYEVLPASWQVGSESDPVEATDNGGDSRFLQSGNSSEAFTFERRLVFSSVSADVVINANEGGTAKLAFAFPSAEVSDNEDAIKNWIVGDSGTAVDVSEDESGATLFAVTLDGKDSAEFDAALVDFGVSPYGETEKFVHSEKTGSGLMDTNYRNSVGMRLPARLTEANPSAPVQWTVGTNDGKVESIEAGGSGEPKLENDKAALALVAVEPMFVVVNTTQLNLIPLIVLGVGFLLLTAVVLGIVMFVRKQKAAADRTAPDHGA